MTLTVKNYVQWCCKHIILKRDVTQAHKATFLHFLWEKRLICCLLPTLFSARDWWSEVGHYYSDPSEYPFTPETWNLSRRLKQCLQSLPFVRAQTRPPSACTSGGLLWSGTKIGDECLSTGNFSRVKVPVFPREARAPHISSLEGIIPASSIGGTG